MVREREVLIYWFTSLAAAMATAETGRKQETHLDLSAGSWGLKHLSHLPPLSPDCYQESELEHLGQEPASIWDAVIADRGFNPTAD